MVMADAADRAAVATMMVQEEVIVAKDGGRKQACAAVAIAPLELEGGQPPRPSKALEKEEHLVAVGASSARSLRARWCSYARRKPVRFAFMVAFAVVALGTLIPLAWLGAVARRHLGAADAVVDVRFDGRDIVVDVDATPLFVESVLHEVSVTSADCRVEVGAALDEKKKHQDIGDFERLATVKFRPAAPWPLVSRRAKKGKKVGVGARVEKIDFDALWKLRDPSAAARDKDDSTSLRRGCFRSHAREKRMARFEVRPEG